MYFYKEKIEFKKLSCPYKEYNFNLVKDYYFDIKNNGMKDNLLINKKYMIQIGGMRYFILKLLNTKNYTKIPCIVYSNEKINNKNEINLELVCKLTNKTKEQIIRSIL